MKSKKKFLLLGVGVMGALALGVGATSTFAWFQVNTAGVKANETSNIGVVKNAELEALTLTATYTGTGNAGAIASVDLTTDSGVGMVWDTVADKAVPATNQSSLVKSEKIVLTLSGSNMGSYVGNVYTVKLKASKDIRISTSVTPSTWTSNSYVGSYNAATAYDSTNHAFTGGDEITLGNIKIDDASTIKYEHDSSFTAVGLTFYASVTGHESSEAYPSAVSSYDGVIGVSSFTLVTE